jgi:hypothetical protein
VVVSRGRINTGFLALVTALFMLSSLPIQARDYTQAVGTIFCDGGIRGIATHIQSPQNFDPNQSVIVTAAHVIYDPKTDEPFDQCLYRPQNKRLGGIEFQTISQHSYSITNSDKVDQAESDLIFIRLKHRAYQPTLNLITDFIEVSKFSFIGSDLELFRQSQCQTINHPYVTSKKLLLHNCPVGMGSSGSPIIHSHSNEIMAVHGGRFSIQTDSISDRPQQWIGQARRIDPSIHSALIDLLSAQ